MVRLDELYLHINPKRFYYLKFLLEGYDNLAILSSCLDQQGVVVIRFPREMTKDLLAFLGAIARNIV